MVCMSRIKVASVFILFVPQIGVQATFSEVVKLLRGKQLSVCKFVCVCAAIQSTSDILVQGKGQKQTHSHTRF